jgi:hypothetical protein
MATVQVRYIVHDVDAAIAFYCDHRCRRRAAPVRQEHVRASA